MIIQPDCLLITHEAVRRGKAAALPLGRPLLDRPAGTIPYKLPAQKSLLRCL